MTTSANDYRIENVQIGVINGTKKIMFSAYQRRGGAYVFVGRLSAPINTPRADLWKIADSIEQE
jgi:hypothetical protein